VALVDVRSLPSQTRLQAADRIRTLTDFALPELEWFNTQPCPQHTSIQEGSTQIPPCRHCGVHFRKHQRVGIAWLYMRGRGLIADNVGTGKTAQAAGVIALCKQVGELDTGRVLVVCKPAAVGQWLKELRRFLPKLLISHAGGPRRQRVEKYLTQWEVMIIGYQMLLQDRELLERIGVGALVIDDVDPLRNPTSRTAYSIKRIARECHRVIVLNGTPLQKQLTEMHSILEPVGGWEVFGSLTRFRTTYVREELVRVYNPSAGRHVNTKRLVGYKNVDDFITRLRPLVLRRTPDDIDDVDLPVITPNTVWLDLHPAQRQRYVELRRGVLRIIREEGTQVKRAKAVAQFTYGQAICAGLSTLGEPDAPGTSSKLDWLEQHLVTGDLSDEKVVVFARFTKTVESLMARLERHRVGHVVIWGRERNPALRERRKDQFWDDPRCRVLIGTEAIEQSLNLQCARHLVNIDQLLNPARMQQLAGRIRRDGSPYKTVYVHNLLIRDTQEEGILDLLEREQALADHIWGESNELFDALNPLALLQLIGRSSGART
jgi:SNF2 family DNA or RNA helicase